MTPNKTKKLILEVIADNSGKGISASEILDKLSDKGVTGYCTVKSYLAEMVDAHQLRRRITKKVYDGTPWAADYYINRRKIA